MRLEDIRTLSERTREFERLLHDLFLREGFKVTVQAQPKVQSTRFFIADLLIESKDGNTAIVEAKLFSSRSMPPSAILSAVNQLETYRRLFNATKGILATAIQISHETKDRLRSLHPALLIYDLDVLVFLFTKYYDLQKRFEELTRAALTFSDVPDANPENVDINADLRDAVAEKISPPPPEPEEPKGKKLCDEINAIQARRHQAKAFERKMAEA